MVSNYYLNSRCSISIILSMSTELLLAYREFLIQHCDYCCLGKVPDMSLLDDDTMSLETKAQDTKVLLESE